MEEDVKRIAVNGISIGFDTTFMDLLKQTKGRGEVLPLETLFRQWSEEDGWIEPGMRALLVDVTEYDDYLIKVYFYFGQHEGYNLPFFKKEFSNYPDTKKDDAIFKGHYQKRTHVLFEKNEKVHKFLKLN